MRPAKSLEHGETGYARTHRCHCAACMAAVRRYDKKVRYYRTKGISRKVSAEPARRHIQQLIHDGVGFTQIAHATNDAVKRTQIKRLIVGNKGKPVTWIFRATQDAILAVTFTRAVRQDCLVPVIGARRRIEALGYLGYSRVDLAAELGISEVAVQNYLKRESMLNKTLTNIDVMYRRLSMTRGTNERARWHAYRLGYAPPLAWDENSLDDPQATPSLMVCIVDHCGRLGTEWGLCSAHHRRVTARDGFRSANRFRLVVIAVGKEATHDSEHTIIELTDLKALGCTKEQAAVRIAKTTDYVETLWDEIV